MKLTEAQRDVVESSASTLVVLGGAGTGKTTTAAFLVRRDLQAAADNGRSGRALFLSFARSSTAQILARSEGVLGRYASAVEVTTFHALAWKLINRWGNVVGLKDPVLSGPAERKVYGSAAGLAYDDLLPIAARITSVPAVAAYLQRRWSVIVVDEFQDISDRQWSFIQILRGSARLVLLGDLNQCIYANLPGSSGVGPRRLTVAMELPGVERLDLPQASHRDPTQLIPAAAEAIRHRDFTHPAVRSALDAGVLEIVHETDPADEVTAVMNQITSLRADGYGVGVFSHHIDSTAVLSDGLNAAGVAHDFVGLPDSVNAALHALYTMLNLACGGATIDDVYRAFAIFVASCERGSAAPPLALAIAGLTSRPLVLDQRLKDLAVRLRLSGTLGEALRNAREAYSAVGLTRGVSPWNAAARLLEGLLGPRILSADGLPPNGVEHIHDALRNHRLSLLTHAEAAEPASVQLMGLYQTKGREVDAAVVVLRSTDWFGRESEPMPDGSKLLYVLLTRARLRTTVLAVGSPSQPLIAPVVALR